MLTIGHLAQETGTKVVTIRYYERIGLLPAPRRTTANYRSYEPRQVDRLRFIRRCRELGFTLEQVRELLRLASQKHQDCRQVDRMAASHLAAIEHKIADLTRLADELRQINRRCRGGGVIASCPIISALSPGVEPAEGDQVAGPRRSEPGARPSSWPSR